MALFGLIPDAKASPPPVSGSYFQYGRDTNANGHEDPNSATSITQGYRDRANFFQTQANNSMGRAAPGERQGQAAVSAADRANALGYNALNGADQARGEQAQALSDQRRAASALGAFAEQPQGPSAAQAQLQAGANQSFQQQLAMARSGPGSSGGAAALRNAAFQQAGIMGQANLQAAQVRAQEDQAYKQQQLEALGGAQQGFGAAANTAQGLRASDIASGQALSNAALQGGQLKTQAQLQYGQLRNQQGALNDQQQNALNQMGMHYDELGNVVTQDQLQADMQQQALRSGQALQASQFNAGVSNQSNQQDIQTAGMIAGAMMLSDTRQKKDAARAEGVAAAFRALGGDDTREARDYETYQGAPDPTANLGTRPSSIGSPFANYDRERGAALTRQLASRDASPDLRDVPGYTYRYRDPRAPGAAPGQQVGPMAQDLEANPSTAHLVRDTPNGKMVDTGRAAMLALPAIGEQQRRLDRLERAQALGMPQSSYGNVDLNALDAAYARERAYR